MPDKGKDLGLDLYRLYLMATRNLPDVAGVYRSAVDEIDKTDSGLSGVFSRPAQLGGPHGAAYGPWCDLRDTIKKILSDTGTNLTDTAHALRLAVDAYSATDDAAAAEFQRLKSRT